MSPDLPVVILAGGKGSRIGGGKPLRLLGGQSLIEHALRQAHCWSSRVAVALRDDRQIGTSAAATIRDEPGIEGPLAGLVAGLEWARSREAELLLAIPCDAPFLPVNLADRLAAEIGASGAALASSGGELHPTCSLWKVAALEAVPSYLEAGRSSLRGLASEVGFATVEWPIGAIDPFFNINDADSLAEAARLLG